MQDEIVRAIRAGKLQYGKARCTETPGCGFSSEVEAVVKQNRGAKFLIDRQVKTELARINRELKRLKTQMAGSLSPGIDYSHPPGIRYPHPPE